MGGECSSPESRFSGGEVRVGGALRSQAHCGRENHRGDRVSLKESRRKIAVGLDKKASWHKNTSSLIRYIGLLVNPFFGAG